MGHPSAAEHVIAGVLEQVERLYDEAVAAIRSAEPDEAFRLATNYARKVRAIHDREEKRLSKLRAEQATRIRDKESLSLAGLAERISVSKSRAQQLVDNAKTKEDQP